MVNRNLIYLSKIECTGTLYVPARLQVSKSSKTGHQVVSKITYTYICILYDTKKYIQIIMWTTLKINKNVKSKKKT